MKAAIVCVVLVCTFFVFHASARPDGPNDKSQSSSEEVAAPNPRGSEFNRIFYVSLFLN
jgi:hypothetical protein